MMPSIGPGSWPDCWSASCSSRTWLDGTALLRGFDPSAADAPTANIPPRNSGATIIEPTRRSMVCRIGRGPPCRDHVCIACATSQSAPLASLPMFFNTDRGKSFLLYVALTFPRDMTRRDHASQVMHMTTKKISRLATLLDG